MFYVIPSDAEITNVGHGTPHPEAGVFSTFGEAKDRAQALHDSFGNHWKIVKTEWVWGTMTVADLRKEGVI